ncbi:hypothetical protein WR25_11150 [Diploscapter pachys]|uniref:glutathione transferase n=1 Tax=Diploscapter pachys TaxID=2018661 RepID=A0A2A2JJH2_9BILA|nr:hypothetical protein WR25_11150 [Diploscapter pachys]
MVQYKLYYFPARGLAEAIRQIILDMPFETMPVLSINGCLLPQSYAILRYLAKQFGKTPLEEATIDALAGLMNDFKYETSPYYNAYFNDEISAEELEKLKTENFKPWLEKLFNFYEKYLRKSNSGFFVDSGVTWIDLFVVDQIGTFINRAPGCLEGHEELQKLRDNVLSIPEIKEWVEKRPVTER